MGNGYRHYLKTGKKFSGVKMGIDIQSIVINNFFAFGGLVYSIQNLRNLMDINKMDRVELLYGITKHSFLVSDLLSFEFIFFCAGKNKIA